ncbi:hypothetical protein [Tunturiibacter gelidiferens]|uniref:Uncharacterized protein n=1 Tax=Tunturiibacter gelidiferens TaxID=3069689 RepID=A0AAU7Z148_9BACT
MKVVHKFSRAGAFLLGIAIMASIPSHVVEKPAMAQIISNDYRFCSVTVPLRKNDPILNGYAAAPPHHYYSELYQGPDRGKEFQAWVRKNYQQEWIYNAYSGGYGDTVQCLVAARPQLFADNMKKVQTDPKQNPYYTFTNWPAVQ